MKRIKVSVFTRLIAGSLMRFLSFITVPLLPLLFISLGLNTSEDIETRVWAVQIAVLIIIIFITFYTYIFFRLGVFYDSTSVMERSLFKTRVFNFKDISSVFFDSTLPGTSTAASNNIKIRQVKANINGSREYTLKTTAMMLSKRRSWRFGSDLWELIISQKPNAKLTISQSSLIWKDFKEFMNKRVS